MGGSALKTVNTVRLPAKEYFDLQVELIDLFKKESIQLIPIKAYWEKESFGDLDIIVPMVNNNISLQVKEVLTQKIKTKEWIRNGNIVSFEYNNFQVDLIFTPVDEVEVARVYYSYNDLNGFIGRVANKFGLKFGFNGLYFPLLKDQNNVVEEILLSKDPEVIYTFLGYDYHRYLKGFSTLEDIFEYVVSGKFFNPNIFLGNSIEKAKMDLARNKKRVNFVSFINWLTVYADGFSDHAWYNFLPNKVKYIEFISDHFPAVNLEERVLECQKQERIKKAVKGLFNGEIVMEQLPQLKAQLLGKFINEFKPYISSKYKLNFHEALLNLSPVEINKEILTYYTDHMRIGQFDHSAKIAPYIIPDEIPRI